MGNQNSRPKLLWRNLHQKYKAINNPRAWSANIESITDKLYAEWKYHFGDSTSCSI